MSSGAGASRRGVDDPWHAVLTAVNVKGTKLKPAGAKAAEDAWCAGSLGAWAAMVAKCENLRKPAKSSKGPVSGVDFLAELNLDYTPDGVLGVDLWHHRLNVHAAVEAERAKRIETANNQRQPRGEAAPPLSPLLNAVTPDGKPRPASSQTTVSAEWTVASANERAEMLKPYQSAIRRVLNFDGTVYQTDTAHKNLKKQLKDPVVCAEAYGTMLDDHRRATADRSEAKTAKAAAAAIAKVQGKADANFACAEANDIGNNNRRDATDRTTTIDEVARINAPAKMRRLYSQEDKINLLSRTTKMKAAFHDQGEAGNAFRMKLHVANDSKGLPPAPLDATKLTHSSVTITFSNQPSPPRGGQPSAHAICDPKHGAGRLSIVHTSAGYEVPMTALLAMATSATKKVADENGWTGSEAEEQHGAHQPGQAPPRTHAPTGVLPTLILGEEALRLHVDRDRERKRRRTSTTTRARDTSTVASSVARDHCVVS